jgi:DHA1 family bicyclomycin/chloramphenicol resistance-like MFS transporter
VTAMTIAAYSTIHELFDGKKVIRILAWMYSVSLLGASFGPMLGMAVLSYGSWRVIFFTLMGWGCISFLLLYLYMPETANKDDVTSLKGAFQSYIRLVLDMNFMRPTLAFCFLFAALMAWITASPFIIMLYFHQSQLFFSIVQAIVFLGFLLGTQTIHFTMNHFDVKHIAQVGLWIGFVGGCCIIAFPLLFDNIWAIVVPMTTITFAIGFSSPILNRLSIEGSEESTGNKLSLFYILVSFFSMVGSFLVTMFNNQGVIAFLVTAFLFSCGWLIIELLFILKRSYSVRALNRK